MNRSRPRRKTPVLRRIHHGKRAILRKKVRKKNRTVIRKESGTAVANVATMTTTTTTIVERGIEIKTKTEIGAVEKGPQRAERIGVPVAVSTVTATVIAIVIGTPVDGTTINRAETEKGMQPEETGGTVDTWKNGTHPPEIETTEAAGAAEAEEGAATA